VASDFHIKISGIEGESQQKGHEKEIEVQSWSFGVSNAGSFAKGGGGGTGKASFQDLHFTTLAFKGSPKLMLACATGEHLKEAVLSMRKAGKTQLEYYQIKLSDVLVSSFQSGGSDGAGQVPTDQFSLNFSKIEMAFSPQKPDGTLDAAVKSGFDLKLGAKV
jgi:type VI secretion system secreted protein Hcp